MIFSRHLKNAMTLEKTFQTKLTKEDIDISSTTKKNKRKYQSQPDYDLIKYHPTKLTQGMRIMLDHHEETIAPELQIDDNVVQVLQPGDFNEEGGKYQSRHMRKRTRASALAEGTAPSPPDVMLISPKFN